MHIHLYIYITYIDAHYINTDIHPGAYQTVVANSIHKYIHIRAPSVYASNVYIHIFVHITQIHVITISMHNK